MVCFSVTFVLFYVGFGSASCERRISNEQSGLVLLSIENSCGLYILILFVSNQAIALKSWESFLAPCWI